MDLSILFKNKSTRHHYVPIFLTRAFTNSNGRLYVYDKENDQKLIRQQSPKKIFCEKGRNTVDVTPIDSTGPKVISNSIEDIYSKIDNNSSSSIRYFQKEELSKIKFSNENTGWLKFFLITLFWRIPKTDSAASKMIDEAVIRSPQIDPEFIRQDPMHRKFYRVGLFNHHIDEIMRGGSMGKVSTNIHQLQVDGLVIGDYPFLQSRQINTFREFNDPDMLFAVSSRRIFSSTRNTDENFTVEKTISYNAAIIHQSLKFIACADRNILKVSIDIYKQHSLHELLEFCFK